MRREVSLTNGLSEPIVQVNVYMKFNGEEVARRRGPRPRSGGVPKQPDPRSRLANRFYCMGRG